MKKLLTIILLLNSGCLSSTYFVATNGNDSNPGTINQPWATWQKAFITAIAGDTVYFRGGVYQTAAIVQGNQSGTKSKPICYLNYPGEMPILDGTNKTSGSHGLHIANQKYLHIKGLIIRNNRQILENDDPSGFVLSNCNQITLENCTSHNNGKRGFYVLEPDTVTIINCDSYNNADILQSATAGNGGDGFLINDDGSDDDTLSYVTISGCRSWHNSDDGFDLGSEGYVKTYNCWSWNNGFLERGNGAGFKFGLKDVFVKALPTRRITNCVAAYNKYHGFTTNDNNCESQLMQIFNNTAFRNGVNPNRECDAYGFFIFKADLGDESENLKRIFKNNLSYGNYTGEVIAELSTWYTHEYNSWDNTPNLIITDADFISIDSTGISGPRHADGSLPDLNGFLRLSSTSKAIDAGVNVGLPFYNNAPDLGAYEYDPQSGTNMHPSVVISSPSTGSTFTAPANITITANASDADGSITKVEFFIGATKLGEKTSAPYSVVWNNVTAGTYSLTAIATDNLNAKTTSSAISISVTY